MLDCEAELLANYFSRDWFNDISTDLQPLINLSESSDPEELFRLVQLGASCLCAFVQLNFVGPPRSLEISIPDDLASVQADSLSLSGDTAYSLCRSPVYLALAKWVFVDCGNKLKALASSSWWKCRTCWIWQQLFSDRRAELRDLQFAEFTHLDDHFSLSALSMDLKISFALEKARAYGFYYEPEKAEIALKEALNLAGLEQFQLTGVLGRRTKFQTRDIPQLTLEGCSADFTGESFADAMKFPLDCRLNDDSLLENTQFQSATPTRPFSPIQECVLVSVLENLRRTHTEQDILVKEIEKAYLDRLLRHPIGYVAKYVCLFRRCRLELNDSRRVERALAQAEELVNGFGREDSCAVASRAKFFFAVSPPPIWDVQRMESKLLFSLGVTSEALRIFIDLQLWDEAVECYRKMGMLDRAEAVIREQLQTKESPYLWCLLGDVVDDESCYLKAWTLSGNRLARAQSSLGTFYFIRKKYNEAIKALDTALSILPLDLKSWYTLGYCAMQAKDHQRAAQAYRRCTTIDADNFEAWNNLAACYVNLGDKNRAFQAIAEATKCNFESAKVWENYVLIAIDTARFREALIGVNRVIDLKGEYDDIPVLEVLVRAAVDDLIEKATGDVGDESTVGNNFRKDLSTLFGRITAKVISKPSIWRLYSDLCRPRDDSLVIEEWEKYVTLLQKAHQTASRSSGWEKNDKEILIMTEYAVRLGESQLKLADLLSPSDRSKHLIASARLMWKGLLANLERSDNGGDTVKKSLAALKQVLEKVENL